MTARRCRWCGHYVAADQHSTTRAVHGYSDNVLAWRTFTQLLCPSCAAAWSIDSPWNRPSQDGDQ